MLQIRDIHYLPYASASLMLIYGVDDEQVGVETADRFVIALDQAGVKDVM